MLTLNKWMLARTEVNLFAKFVDNPLTHFWAMLPLYIPWKQVFSILVFLVDMKESSGQK